MNCNSGHVYAIAGASGWEMIAYRTDFLLKSKHQLTWYDVDTIANAVWHEYGWHGLMIVWPGMLLQWIYNEALIFAEFIG